MLRFIVLLFGLLQLLSGAPESPAVLIQKSVDLQREGKLAESAALMKDLLATPGLSAPVKGLVLNELALSHHSRNEYDEAERLYIRALRVLEEAEGSPPINLARARMNLACLYMEWERYDVAERQIDAVPMNILTEAHDISQLLGLRASLATARGHLTKAQMLHEEILAFLQRNCKDCEPQIATAFNNLGAIAARRKKWDDAERWLQVALESQRLSAGDSHPNLMKVLINLAFAQFNQKKYAEAETSLREALQTSKASLGDLHPMTVTILMYLSDTLDGGGKKKEAKAVKKEAAVLKRQIPPPLPGGMTVDVSTLQSFTGSGNQGNSGNARMRTRQVPPAEVSGSRQQD